MVSLIAIDSIVHALLRVMLVWALPVLYSFDPSYQTNHIREKPQLKLDQPSTSLRKITKSWFNRFYYYSILLTI